MRDFPYMKGETARAFRLYAKYDRLVAPLQAAEAGELVHEVASQEERFSSPAQGRDNTGAPMPGAPIPGTPILGTPILGTTTRRMVARGGLAVAGQRGERRFLELVEELEKGRG